MFVNTGQEFDGSDAGARPDEAVSWGKIKSVASPVKVSQSLFSAFGNKSQSLFTCLGVLAPYGTTNLGHNPDQATTPGTTCPATEFRNKATIS